MDDISQLFAKNLQFFLNLPYICHIKTPCFFMSVVCNSKYIISKQIRKSNCNLIFTDKQHLFVGVFHYVFTHKKHHNIMTENNKSVSLSEINRDVLYQSPQSV